LTVKSHWHYALALLPALAACEEAAPNPVETPAGWSETALRQACVRASACGVQVYPRVSNCLDSYHELSVPQGLRKIYEEIYTCVNAAGGDCAAVRGCFGAEEICDRDFAARCEGDTAVSCDLIGGRTFTLRCAAAGMGCYVDPEHSFSAKCSFGPCDSGTHTCRGGVIARCEGGQLLAVRDCTATGGLTCQIRDVGYPACEDPQAARCHEVPAEERFRCEEHHAIYCSGDHMHQEDCRRWFKHGTCEKGRCAVPDGAECAADEVNRCAGEQLEACIHGRWVRIDCRALGLAGCAAAGGGANCAEAGRDAGS